MLLHWVLSIQFSSVFCRFLGYETSKVDLPVHVKTTESTPQIIFFKQKYGHEEKELLCIVSMVPPRGPQTYPVILFHLLINYLFICMCLFSKIEPLDNGYPGSLHTHARTLTLDFRLIVFLFTMWLYACVYCTEREIWGIF